MPQGGPHDRVLVGRIRAAHGIRGEVKLESFTADAAAIKDYGPLETQGGRHLQLGSLRPAGPVFIARIAGIDTRNDAELLRGVELYVPRDRLPEPGEDEVYLHDLIGKPVVLADGTAFGHVHAVQDYGAGALLEIMPPDARATVLVPLAPPYVPDMDSDVIRLDLPADYLGEMPEKDPKIP